MRLVDLFCGAGGLSAGCRSLGHELLAGVDQDAHALRTYALNFPNSRSVQADLSVIETAELLDRIGCAASEIDIVVGGSVGHSSCFMAQAGNLVVCGDADEGLGDSLYEGRIFVRGRVAGLGADCIEKPMRGEHLSALAQLLARAGLSEVQPEAFRRYGSARQLFHFKVDNASQY